MILQYFKKKENEYKKIADDIYLKILEKSKYMMKNKYFIRVNFDTSFELLSILLIFYLKINKKNSNKKNKNINEELIKIFIQDIDKTMREAGIGDISIGKYVKKYVNKFYFRIKKVDPILDNFSYNALLSYINTLSGINSENSEKLTKLLAITYEDINSKNGIN